MKIAILTPTLHEFSGIDRVVELQAKQYIQQGNNVSVFALDATIALNGVPIVVLGMPKRLFWQRVYRLFFFFDIFKIFRYIKALRNFDVIYSHLYPMNILAVLSKMMYKKTYIYYNHGVSPAGTFQTVHEKIYIAIFRFLNNLTAKYADRIISISQYLADIFQKETGRSSEVTYNQIDEKRFYTGIDGSEVRQRYHIGKNPLILYIGRISPHKGIDLLIQSFKLVLQSIPDVKLLIVGKHTFNGYTQKLQKMSNAAIIFTGFVPDEELPFYYAACDVYATASLWEGFDMPLMEAQACGKPVVAFDIGPRKELINDKGILVQQKDIESFASAIETILKRYV